MTRLNCRETVRVGNAEDGKRPLINPKASAMKQDEQTRAQQKWDKEHGGKPAPKVNAIDPRTGRLNCREQNSDAAPLTGVNLKRLFESGKSNKEIVAEAKKRMERETKKPGRLNCREQNGKMAQCPTCGVDLEEGGCWECGYGRRTIRRPAPRKSQLSAAASRIAEIESKIRLQSDWMTDDQLDALRSELSALKKSQK